MGIDPHTDYFEYTEEDSAEFRRRLHLLVMAKKKESVEQVAKIVGYKGHVSFDTGCLYMGVDGELHEIPPKEPKDA